MVLLNDFFYWVLPVGSESIGEFFILKFDAVKGTFSTVSNLKQNEDAYPRSKHYLRMLSTGVHKHNNLCVCQLFHMPAIAVSV